MKIYTKKGDKGDTSLIGGKRVPKDDVRVEAYGTLDELSAHVALLRDTMEDRGTGDVRLLDDLLDIQRALMTAEALLACDEDSAGSVPSLCGDHVALLERRIDEMTAELPPVGGFVLPGGHVLVSLAHVCRTVCRRAERETIAASRCFCTPEAVLCYLNRLSDYFYTLSRKLSADFNVKEMYWMAEQ